MLQEETLQKQPVFTLSNKDVVDELLLQAREYGLINEETLATADDFIKGAKKIQKVVENERLNFTRQLDDIKKEAMKPEKEIELVLKPLEDQVIKVKKEIYAREEAKRQEEARKQQEIVRAQQAEIKRVESHKSNLVSFKSTLLNKLQSSTLETIDSVERSIRGQVTGEDTWQEFAPEAKAIVEEVKAMFTNNRLDLHRAANDKAAADKLAAERAEAKRIADEEAEKQRQAIASETFSNTMAATREADAAIQQVAKESAKVSGVRTVKKYEVINEDSVPERYWIIDHKKIADEVKGGIFSIPGIRIYDDIISTGR